MAFSIMVTGYGLLVSGLTHLSATMVAMSRNDDSSCASRSFCVTCNSPLARICWNGSVSDWYSPYRQQSASGSVCILQYLYG